MAGKTVAVVGGGVAGMAATMQLAKHGATVNVYELRPPGFERSPNSWVVLLSGRGMRCLKQLGIDTDHIGPALRCVGIARHPASGSSTYFAGWDDSVRLGADQAALSQFMQDRALELYPNRIVLHFGCKLLGGQLARRELEFRRTATGETFTATADLIVGADGGNSTVRELMATQVEGFSVSLYPHFSALLSITFPSLKDVDLVSEKRGPLPLFPPEPAGRDWAAEGWSLGISIPTDERVAGPVVMATRPDGGMECAIVMSDTFWQERNSADSLIKKLPQLYPQVPVVCLKALAEAAAGSPKVRSLPTSVKCSALSTDSVLLVGDAAHAVAPTTGQGAQSALEDSLVLTQALLQAKGNIPQTCRAYNELRLGDAHALVDLDRWSLMALPRSPAPWLLKALTAMLFAHDQMLSKGLSFLPSRFRPANMLELLRDGALSYSQVKRGLLIKSALLTVASIAPVLAVAAKPLLL